MRYNFLPSFARRKGRITKLQEKNLSFLADYSLDHPNTLNDNPSFDKIALEIGFGNGEDFFSFAKEKNNTLFLASEVYKSGIGNLIGKIREHSIENICIYEGDIRDLIFEEEGFRFDEVYIICPDPWPKEKHHKRRLIDNNFLKMLNKFMKKNAQLYISTDWENYAESISCSINEDNLFMETNKKYLNNVAHSKFERKGHEEGRKIFKFNYEKIL